MKPIQCVLFDLDGTLLDTAPDLVFACNEAIRELGLEPISYDSLKPQVSNGAIAMLNHALAVHQAQADFEPLLERMLTLYQQNIAVNTRFFDGMETLLDELERRNLSWGIVTNKHERFTLPLIQALNIQDRVACVISGDTLPEQKPHPMPLLEACKQLGHTPQTSVYIGDARRDIQAGLNAGMATLAALYGYIGHEDPAESWGADAMIQHPLELLNWLDEIA